MAMDDREAAGLHHAVYRIADGGDPDRTGWYAQRLTTPSDLRPARKCCEAAPEGGLAVVTIGLEGP